MKIPKLFNFIILIILIPVCGFSQVRVAKLFSDGMVMQREQQVPVWGWAQKGEKVNVSFDNKSYSARPDNSGKWMVKLPSLPAGGPYQMTIAGKKDKIVVSDIFIGASVVFPLVW